MNLSFDRKVMLGVRVIYIYYSHLYFPFKHHPRALRTRHSLNESNVLLQHTLLAKIFFTESIFKALHISSVHLLALIPAVAEPTRITPVQVRESTSVGSNVLQTV
jgi:hypothetical protein